MNWNIKKARWTVEGTIGTLQTTKMGVCVPGVTAQICTISFTCPTCNSNRKWSYESKLGNKYTKLDVHANPFRDTSIDVLGELKVKAFQTSRIMVKNYPPIIKCLYSGAVTIQMMEESKTKDVILALLRLETCWGILFYFNIFQNHNIQK